VVKTKVSKVYLLNAIALNMFKTPSTIKISTVTPEQAKEIIKGKELVNAVGHEATMEIVNMLLGLQLKPNRAQVKLDYGDEAIALALNQRLAEGQVVRSLEELQRIGYMLYHITVHQ